MKIVKVTPYRFPPIFCTLHSYQKNKPTHSQPIGSNLNRIIEHVFDSHFQSFQHYKGQVWEIKGVGKLQSNFLKCSLKKIYPQF